MIQRIQSVYLAVAAILCIVCLCLPIGHFVEPSGEVIGTLYNLWVHIPAPLGSTISTDPTAPVLAQEAAGTHLFAPWALFALLVLIASGQIFTIFIYKQRLVQSRLAMLCCILLIGWYAVYVAFAFILPARYDSSFQLSPWAAFPALSCVLTYLAFRAILKDEMMVRSLDRLR